MPWLGSLRAASRNPCPLWARQARPRLCGDAGMEDGSPEHLFAHDRGLTGQRAHGLERWACPRARLSAPTSRALLVALRLTAPSTQGKRSPCSIAKVCFEDQEGDRKMSEAGSCL